jgi:hypothetical protein
VSRKLYARFWQFNPALAGFSNHGTTLKNPNIETRNTKQYQNPNALNSKQKRTCTIGFRFNH